MKLAGNFNTIVRQLVDEVLIGNQIDFKVLGNGYNWFRCKEVKEISHVLESTDRYFIIGGIGEDKAEVINVCSRKKYDTILQDFSKAVKEILQLDESDNTNIMIEYED